jgi:hypothetical protein
MVGSHFLACGFLPFEIFLQAVHVIDAGTDLRESGRLSELSRTGAAIASTPKDKAAALKEKTIVPKCHFGVAISMG